MASLIRSRWTPRQASVISLVSTPDMFCRILRVRYRCCKAPLDTVYPRGRVSVNRLVGHPVRIWFLVGRHAVTPRGGVVDRLSSVRYTVLVVQGVERLVKLAPEIGPREWLVGVQTVVDRRPDIHQASYSAPALHQAFQALDNTNSSSARSNLSMTPLRGVTAWRPIRDQMRAGRPSTYWGG